VTSTRTSDEARGVEFKIHDARFVVSSPDTATLPEAELPEIAFVGRSNVGKSSLLNTLVDRKGLVKVSSTPGRTRLINLFRVDVSRVEGPRVDRKELMLVDLPGYGFADAPKSERRKFAPMVQDYVKHREALAAVCQLFDARHVPSALDRETFRAVGAHAQTHLLVATKADKLPLAKQKPAAKEIAKAFGISGSQVILFSSTTRKGRVELWQRLWDELP
jgi:GTP-binding protein